VNIDVSGPVTVSAGSEVVDVVIEALPAFNLDSFWGPGGLTVTIDFGPRSGGPQRVELRRIPELERLVLFLPVSAETPLPRQLEGSELLWASNK
jgi:hypothetical protein